MPDNPINISGITVFLKRILIFLINMIQLISCVYKAFMLVNRKKIKKDIFPKACC